jgi:hypothetical protein
MSGWRPVPERPGFEVNAAGRVRRASSPGHNPLLPLAEMIRDLPDMETKGYAVMRAHQGVPVIAIEPEPDEDGDDGEELKIASITQIPTGWSKGQLLNVRNRGEYYVVTLFPEESDPRYPERELRFTNPALCQAFVSRWYTREHFDPRAF